MAAEERPVMFPRSLYRGIPKDEWASAEARRHFGSGGDRVRAHNPIDPGAWLPEGFVLFFA